MTRTQLQPYIELSLAMTIAGSTVGISKIITGSFPLYIAAALRFAIAMIIILPLYITAGHGLPKLSKKDYFLLFMQAFTGNFLFCIFLLYGLKWISAAESGIILGTGPVVIGLLSYIFFKEPLTWNKVLAMFIAAACVGAISGFSPFGVAQYGVSALKGYLLIFGAVIDPSMGDDLRVTVIATGFDRTTANPTSMRTVTERPIRINESQPAQHSTREPEKVDVPAGSASPVDFKRVVHTEDLDVPAFLRNRNQR